MISRRILSVLVLLLLLQGCKEVLYSGLAERDANEIVAALDKTAIKATRERAKDGSYSVLVDGDSIARATDVLTVHGLPREKFSSLGDIFVANSILGTPFEQHVRYIHAINQELSETISSISGVRRARVMVTAEPKSRSGRSSDTPPTASVAVVHEDPDSAADIVAKIKVLVSHSFPEIDYEDVAVVLFRHEEPVFQAPEANSPVQMGFFPTESFTEKQLYGLSFLDVCIFFAAIVFSLGVFRYAVAILKQNSPNRRNGN